MLLRLASSSASWLPSQTKETKELSSLRFRRQKSCTKLESFKTMMQLLSNNIMLNRIEATKNRPTFLKTKLYHSLCIFNKILFSKCPKVHVVKTYNIKIQSFYIFLKHNDSLSSPRRPTFL